MADNAVVRWWRRQNFSLPLIWLSVVVYAVGLGHFARANDDALGALWGELRAVGADPEGLWTVLSSGRHGVATAIAFAADVELVSPPLPEPQWYGALAGLVAVAVLGIVAVRLGVRDETWAPVTIDETIVLAVALTGATVPVGGPLLAGAVLMPFLFTVIVYHTRRLPGWKPSYLYVVPVLAPAAGFAAAFAGNPTLAVDLVAFVIVPLAGALGLPLRATIRKHFGR